MVEVADYSLGGFRKVHEEKACTTVAKQWRIPGIKNLPETPTIDVNYNKKASRETRDQQYPL